MSERPTLDELRAKIEAATPRPSGRVRVECTDCGWTGSRKHDNGRPEGYDCPFGWCPECSSDQVYGSP